MHAQKLYGFVLEQNSGNKPVPGVMVKAMLANQTLTTANGSYTLTFQNAKPGYTAVLNIEKEKWVITEASKLEVNLPIDPFSHPHTIIMCRAEVWVKQNQDNNKLLNKILQDALQKQKAAISRQSSNYQKIIDSLEEQYVRSQRNLGEITEALSRVNLDEVSETEKAAYAYFSEGKTEEATLLRETLQSEKNLLLANQRLKHLQENPTGNDSSLVNVYNTIALHRRNLKEEITLAKLRFDWKTAERKLKFLAENDSSDQENLVRYGVFLQSRNAFDKAQQVYDKALAIYTKLNKESDNAFGAVLVSIWYHYAAILTDKHQYKEAESLLLQAYDSYSRLSQKEPAMFRPQMVHTMIALADVHTALRLFQKSSKEYGQAGGICSQFRNSDPVVYDALSAEAQNRQGQQNMLMQNYPAAEKLFKSALELRKRLDSLRPLSQEVDIAALQRNLGTAYISQKKFDAAKVLLEYALALYTKFQYTSPSVFNPLAAAVHCDLGEVYMERSYLGTYAVSKADSAIAHNHFDEAVQSLRSLAARFPQVYEPALANTCMRFGNFFYEANDRDSAEALYTEAMDIYEKFAGACPEAFDIPLANVQQKLAKIYILRNGASAKILLDKALAVYKKHAAAGEDMEEDITGAMFDLTVADYYSRTAYSKSDKEDMLKKDIEQFKALQAAYESLDKRKPGRYTENIKSVKTFIASINSELERVKQVDKSVYTETSEKDKAQYELNGIMDDIETAATVANKLMLQQLLVTKKKGYIQSGLFTDIISLGHDLNGLSWYLLLSKKFKEAEQAAREALNPGFKKPEGYDTEIEYAKANLALSLLLQDKYDDAKAIYASLKGKSYTDGTTYVSMFLDDMAQMEKAGITHKDFEKIKAFLVE
ncbi:MAG: hypothetical protein BGP14_14525 [Sphingobacteriales bacterium 44-15]|nr:MAG: hypothetical protein BGP14_14525 [Sphingobacteriales bacterium 44-15]